MLRQEINLRNQLAKKPITTNFDFKNCLFGATIVVKNSDVHNELDA